MARTSPAWFPGTEVLSIDGVATAQILAALMTVARVDGSNDAKRVTQMEVQGFATHRGIRVCICRCCSHRFPLTRCCRYARRERARHARCGSAASTQRNAMAPQRAHDSAAPAWTLTMDSADLAILRMPDWALYESRWDWHAFLARRFVRIVCHYLGSLLPRLGHACARLQRAFLHARFPTRRGGAGVPPLRTPHFAGQVFVLTSAENSSATFEFAQQVQRNGLATLVGQPTGGNLRGINGSAFFFLHLPSSQIEVDLPLVGQFPISAQPDRGVLPDVPVHIKAQDLQDRRDAEMDMVRALLRGDGTPPQGERTAPA